MRKFKSFIPQLRPTYLLVIALIGLQALHLCNPRAWPNVSFLILGYPLIAVMYFFPKKAAAILSFAYAPCSRSRFATMGMLTLSLASPAITIAIAGISLAAHQLTIINVWHLVVLLLATIMLGCMRMTLTLFDNAASAHGRTIFWCALAMFPPYLILAFNLRFNTAHYHVDDFYDAIYTGSSSFNHMMLIYVASVSVLLTIGAVAYATRRGSKQPEY